MVSANIEQLYERQIRGLSPDDRIRLLQLIARDLVEPDSSDRRKRSIMELEGLGAEIWEGVDAQQYVNELRKEWDHRP
jgi:hypothetical protein